MVKFNTLCKKYPAERGAPISSSIKLSISDTLLDVFLKVSSALRTLDHICNEKVCPPFGHLSKLDENLL